MAQNTVKQIIKSFTFTGAQLLKIALCYSWTFYNTVE